MTQTRANSIPTHRRKRSTICATCSVSSSSAPPGVHSFLHDALPIYRRRLAHAGELADAADQLFVEAYALLVFGVGRGRQRHLRSEEHTSELQSHSDLVCRLLLEKKKLVQESERSALLRRLSAPPQAE